MKRKAQVCIIGGGFAGSIIALELIYAGVTNTVIVEAGKAYEMGNSNEWMRFLSTGVSPFVEGYDDEIDYENYGTYAYKLRGGRLWARGGSSLIWTGHAFRLKPEDFRLYTNTGSGADWPLDYYDLEPYYAEAEATLRVAGCSQDDGHPERSGPFPFTEFEYSTEDTIYLDAFNRLNISYQHNCISRNKTSIDHYSKTPACQAIGTCEYCPEQARFTGDQLLDHLESSGLSILTETSALRLRFDSKTKAKSLDILNLTSGQVDEIEAEIFIICGGGIESPKLLLASSCKFWRNGVGNDHGLVGHYFTEHAAITVTGVHTRRNANRRYLDKVRAFNTACSRHYDSPEHQAEGKFLIEVADVRAYDLPFKFRLHKALPHIGEELRRPFALSALIETIPQKNNCVKLSKGHNRFGIPRTAVQFSIDLTLQEASIRVRKVLADILREIGCKDITPSISFWWPRHHMGTCRMSNSVIDGVVDTTLRVHGTKNVFVCSSAVFPTGGAANPTLTIAALSHRLGQHLVRMLIDCT